MVAKNIVTDYGAEGDGINDDSPEFAAFNADVQGLNIELTIPPGEYLFNSNPTLAWASGIPVFDVTGTGATLTIGASGGFFLGGGDMDPHAAITDPAGISARINTVSAGATTVALTSASATAGYISRFTVGRYMCVTGYDIQGLWQSANGFPPNFQFFEYVQITDVDTVANTVSFTPALRYSYRSDWPLMNEGDRALEIDAAGPATIFAMAETWDTSVDYDGLTINSPVSQIKASGRSVTYRNCTFPGNIPFPSVLGTWSAIDCTISGDVEIEGDKLADTVICNGGNHYQWKFQSSSIRLFQVDGTTIRGGINGTPLNTTLDNMSAAGLQPGAVAHGLSDTLVVRNSTISALSVGGLLEQGASNEGVNNYATMSGGVITIPNTNNYHATRVFVPGYTLFWSGAYQTMGAFRVVGVTQDATNVYVQTSLAGGFPDLPLSAGKLNIRTPPVRSATFVNVTGCADVVDLSQPGAWRRPLYSYSKRTYDGTTGATGAEQVRMWGNLVSLKVNVTTAYTGAQSTLTFGLGQFDNYPVILTDSSAGTYGPRFNLKVTGERVITVGSTTGAQTGDTNLNVSSDIWFTGPIQPSISADISGETSDKWPVFTVEIITDQDIDLVRTFTCSFVAA